MQDYNVLSVGLETMDYNLLDSKCTFKRHGGETSLHWNIMYWMLYITCIELRSPDNGLQADEFAKPFFTSHGHLTGQNTGQVTRYDIWGYINSWYHQGSQSPRINCILTSAFQYTVCEMYIWMYSVWNVYLNIQCVKCIFECIMCEMYIWIYSVWNVYLNV